MDTSRDDVGISIRSALLDKGVKQRFSLLSLVILSIILIFTETLETRPLDIVRSFFKDVIYRSSIVISAPENSFNSFNSFVKSHLNLYENYEELKKENNKLKNSITETDFLELENTQLRKIN